MCSLRDEIYQFITDNYTSFYYDRLVPNSNNVRKKLDSDMTLEEFNESQKQQLDKADDHLISFLDYFIKNQNLVFKVFDTEYGSDTKYYSTLDAFVMIDGKPIFYQHAILT